jgi:hypothetical protein
MVHGAVEGRTHRFMRPSAEALKSGAFGEAGAAFR